MNNKIKDFRDLEIYNLADKLTLEIYKLTNSFPSKEKYAIVDQLNRSASSVGANIAEGFGRYHTKDYIKFLYIARGSLMEVLHFLILAKKLQYLDKNSLNRLDEEIKILGVKINNLISALFKQLVTRSHKETQGDAK